MIRNIVFFTKLFSSHIALIFIISFFTLNLSAKSKTVKIAVSPFKPFVIKQDERFIGFSIDLWEKIADKIKIDYQYIEVPSILALLGSVKKGESEIAFSGISMTPEREKFLDYSYPVFNSGFQIMVLKKFKSSFTDILYSSFSIFFSTSIFYAVFILCAILILSAHVIWLLERNHNPHFPKKYIPGVCAGLWWSAVTVTTVGYGDKTPSGAVARFFALILMFSGIIILAYYTASVTATITVSELHGKINNMSDLLGKKVATVSKSTSDHYLSRQNLTLHSFEKIEDAYHALESELVDAIVYDSPVLLYYASHEGTGKVKVVGPVFHKEDYGIAFKTKSRYIEAVNQTILEFRKNGIYQRIYNKWFGKS